MSFTNSTPAGYYIYRDGSWELLPNTANPELVGVEDRFEGKWLTEDGFISSSKKVQDNEYYQNFSYEIQSTLPPDRWEVVLKENIHPSGFKMFNVLVPGEITDAGEFIFTNFTRWHHTFHIDFSDELTLEHQQKQKTVSNDDQIFVLSNNISKVDNEQKRFATIQDYADTSIDFFFRIGNHSNSFYFAGPPEDESIYLTEGPVQVSDSQYLSFGLNTRDETKRFNKSSYYLRAIDDWAINSYNDIQIRRFDLDKDIQTIRKRVLNEHIVNGNYEFGISTDFLDQIFKDHVDYNDFIDPNGTITTISTTFDMSNSMVFREGHYISLDTNISVTATKAADNKVTIIINVSPETAIPEYHDLIEIHLFKSKTAPVVFEHLMTNGTELELNELYNNSDILVFEELSGSDHWIIHDQSIAKINQTKLLLDNSDINSNSKIRVFVFPRIKQNSSNRQFTKGLSFTDADFTAYLNETTDTIRTNQIVVPFEYRSSYMNQHR